MKGQRGQRPDPSPVGRARSGGHAGSSVLEGLGSPPAASRCPVASPVQSPSAPGPERVSASATSAPVGRATDSISSSIVRAPAPSVHPVAPSFNYGASGETTPAGAAASQEAAPIPGTTGPDAPLVEHADPTVAPIVEAPPTIPPAVPAIVGASATVDARTDATSTNANVNAIMNVTEVPGVLGFDEEGFALGEQEEIVYDAIPRIGGETPNQTKYRAMLDDSSQVPGGWDDPVPDPGAHQVYHDTSAAFTEPPADDFAVEESDFPYDSFHYSGATATEDFGGDSVDTW